MDDRTTKRCSVCTKELPCSREYFSPDKRAKDGLSCRCKACHRIVSEKYRNANKEKTIQATRRWQATHQENLRAADRRSYQKHKVERNQKSRAWGRANAERKRNYKRLYNQTHRDQVLNTSRQWHRNNPEKRRQYQQRRVARQKNLPATLTDAEWEQIKAEWGFACAYCGAPWWEAKLVQEHVIPISQNGPYTRDNIVPACPSCNHRKKDRTPEQAGMKLRERHI